MNFPEGLGGLCYTCGNSGGVGGAISSLQKWKIQGGGGVLSEIPSMVGVWIFSGTTHFYLVVFTYIEYSILIHILGVFF